MLDVDTLGMYLVQINLFVIISWYEKWVLLLLLKDIIVYVNLFQQLRTYQNISVTLGLLDIEDIVTETGCKVPCRYTEYSLPTSSVDTYILDNETTFGILMASKKVEKRTQIMMYPFPSFVSESGGALGLFVGFSFNMLWDLGEVCFHLLLRRK